MAVGFAVLSTFGTITAPVRREDRSGGALARGMHGSTIRPLHRIAAPEILGRRGSGAVMHSVWRREVISRCIPCK